MMRKNNNNIIRICGYIIICILSVQFINGGQLNRTRGLYDLDEDGRKEDLIINGSDRKALLIEASLWVLIPLTL